MTRPSRRTKYGPLADPETGVPDGDDIDWETGQDDPPSITVEDEGTPLASLATSLDFVGAGVTASGTGATKTITIPGVGSIDLDDLADVDAPTPSDGDVLTWDSGTSEWVNEAPAGGGGVTVQDEGSPLTTTATTLDFTGAGVTASGSGATKTINIPGSAGGLSKSFVGYNTVGGSWQAMTGARVYCKKVSLTADDLVVGISAYVRNAADNISGWFSVNSTTPGVARWLTLPIGWTCPTTGDYWICMAMGGTTAHDIAYDGSGTDKYFTPSAFYATSAYPSAWAITTTTQKFSIRALVVA
jgi:hypothetical protein